MDKVRLTLNKDEATITEGADSFIGQLIAGTKGKVKIKTPFMQREIHNVKREDEKSIGKPKKGKNPK